MAHSRPSVAQLLMGAVVLILQMLGPGPARAEQLSLRDGPFTRTAEGRQLLQYLVNCALPPDTTVAFEAGSVQHVLTGALGLAPGWSRRALTAQEERRISGCILARTNFYGIPVKLSMRSEAPDAGQVLKAGDEERSSFPFFEAAFFGNIFKPERETYVCTGDNPAGREQHLESLLRVCSLSAPDALDAAGPSRCGFVITGACKDESFQRNGVDYSADAIRIYLPAAAAHSAPAP
jgi:hypothetical protein